MGYYINKVKDSVLPAAGKAKWLLTIGEATVAPTPVKFQPNLVCVVENFGFDAAAFAYSEREMQEFLTPDGRNKTWLIVPDADKLSGYKD